MSKAVAVNKKPRIVKRIQTIVYDPKDSRKIAVIHEQKIEKNLGGYKVSKKIVRKSPSSIRNLENFIKKTDKYFLDL